MRDDDEHATASRPVCRTAASERGVADAGHAATGVRRAGVRDHAIVTLVAVHAPSSAYGQALSSDSVVNESGRNVVYGRGATRRGGGCLRREKCGERGTARCDAAAAVAGFIRSPAML